MNRLYLFLIMLAVAVMPALAGDKGEEKSREDMRKELHEYKMKYLAQEIELQSDQQKKFVELYEKMSKERRKVFEGARKLNDKVKSVNNATDEDYAKASESLEKAKAAAAEIEKRYDAQFAKFLTQKQIYKLHEAEKVWREKMRELRGNREGKSRLHKK